MNHQELKTRQRAERAGYPPNLALRVHRAISWLGRSEAEAEDPDARFVFLWIAFNAAYATDIDDAYKESEQVTFKGFLQKLLKLDGKGRFERLIWDEFSGSIRVLLDNPYVSYDFWNFHNGRLEEEEWKRRFAKANAGAKRALAHRKTNVVLSIVLARIYTFRNQILHGGATWNSSVNRDQVRDCSNFLGKLVPLIIEVMMDHPKTLWGDAVYPVVE